MGRGSNMDSVAPKCGYIARKRKARLAACEQTMDEYGVWLCSSGLARESSKGFVASLDKAMKKNKNKSVNKTMADMRMLLSSNPILAQDITLDYQQHMRPHYEKLLPVTSSATVPKKKQRTQT